jgi:hypothetical protein
MLTLNEPHQKRPEPRSIMDPVVAELAVSLSSAAVRTTASSVQHKIRALKTAKKDKETIAGLEEIVNDLLEEKSEILRIARAYEDQLVSQQISDDDITYITESVPKILDLFITMGDTSESDRGAMETLQTLVSAESVRILQLLGFNYRKAIGEPLTEVANAWISETLMPSTMKNQHQKPSKNQNQRR